MFRPIEAKLYLTDSQERTLGGWMDCCCWLYNRCLEMRIKAWKRRRESVSFNAQCAMLARWRSRIPHIAAVPSNFARDALRRVDRGFSGFFSRCKRGETPGFPRFRSHRRFNSIECLAPGNYMRPGNLLSIPKLGLVRFRAGDQRIEGNQRLLRVIRRASGWYAQVLIDDGKPEPAKVEVKSSVGVDVGLTHFATLSTGEKIDNPRFAKRSKQKLKALERRACRRKNLSRRRAKAVKSLARHHERVAAQRKDFAHQQSRRLINEFDLIAFEKLNVAGMVKNHKLASSIIDAAWGQFIRFVTYKAENAGRHAVAVNPRGTSQECPGCGAVKAKRLSEREHRCDCGYAIDRDHAAAQIILSRALRVVGAKSPVEELVTVGSENCHQIGPVKREGSHHNTDPLPTRTLRHLAASEGVRPRGGGWPS